jgi:hypothetical protein
MCKETWSMSWWTGFMEHTSLSPEECVIQLLFLLLNLCLEASHLCHSIGCDNTGCHSHTCCWDQEGQWRHLTQSELTCTLCFEEEATAVEFCLLPPLWKSYDHRFQNISTNSAFQPLRTHLHTSDRSKPGTADCHVWQLVGGPHRLRHGKESWLTWHTALELCPGGSFFSVFPGCFVGFSVCKNTNIIVKACHSS